MIAERIARIRNLLQPIKELTESASDQRHASGGHIALSWDVVYDAKVALAEILLELKQLEKENT